jgi:hypothetical protein
MNRQHAGCFVNWLFRKYVANLFPAAPESVAPWLVRFYSLGGGNNHAQDHA